MSTTAKRFSTEEAAQVEVYGHVGIMDVQLKNLSKTGAFIEMSQGEYVPQKGDLLNLTVTLDKLQKSHNVDAQVVWSKGAGMGICFITKDEVLERMMAKSNDV
ncbi:PilZ domain protein [compost metagenome]